MEKKVTTDIEILGNVLHSTENALSALLYLERNLITGRFKDGIEPYTMMCRTLIGQRKWADNFNDGAIDSNFNQIARTSKSIIDILRPYVQNLELLVGLERENSSDVKSDGAFSDSIKSTDHRDQEMIIQIFKKRSQKEISYTSLRSELGWERKKLDEQLKAMEKNSIGISISVNGTRKMVTFNS